MVESRVLAALSGMPQSVSKYRSSETAWVGLSDDENAAVVSRIKSARCSWMCRGSFCDSIHFAMPVDVSGFGASFRRWLEGHCV